MNFIARYLKNKIGASLMELTVALGIMGILVMGGGSLTSMVASSTHTSNTRTNAEALTQLVRLQLSQSDLCVQALGEANANLYPTVLPGNANPNNEDWQNPTGLELNMRILNLRSGINMDKDRLVSANGANYRTGDDILPLMGLKVESLRLADSYATGVVSGTQTEYLGRVYLQVSMLQNNSGGQAMRPMMLGPILFTRDRVTRRLKSCRNTFAQSTPQVCAMMGCSYNVSNTPPCSCPAVWSGCLNPGDYPVAIRGGVMFCRSMGGECPAGTMVTGVGVGEVFCMNESNVEVYFSAANSTVIEGATGNILVRMSVAPTSNKVATISAIAGGATQGADYTVANWSVTIAAGQTTATFPVNVVNDFPNVDDGETVTFRITAVDTGISVRGSGQDHVLTINDPSCLVPVATNWSIGENTCESDAAVPIAHTVTGQITDSFDGGTATGTRSYSCNMKIATPVDAGVCNPTAIE